VRSPTKPTALALRRSGICAMLACRTSLWRLITRSGERARRSFRDAAWWRAPVDIRPELTDGTAARRSGDARAPGAESSRATGFSGKPDVGEPFEQDPNHDLTMEATSPTSRSNGTSRPKALTATTQFDRRQGTTARRRPSPAQSKTDGSTATVGLDWPTRFGRGDAISSIARSSAWQPMDG